MACANCKEACAIVEWACAIVEWACAMGGYFSVKWEEACVKCRNVCVKWEPACGFVEMACANCKGACAIVELSCVSLGLSPRWDLQRDWRTSGTWRPGKWRSRTGDRPGSRPQKVRDARRRFRRQTPGYSIRQCVVREWAFARASTGSRSTASAATMARTRRRSMRVKAREERRMVSGE
jgi:hypothetical protein